MPLADMEKRTVKRLDFIVTHRVMPVMLPYMQAMPVRYIPMDFLPLITSDIIDFSTAVGFRTKFGDWNFDISNNYGINTFDFGVENSVNYTQFAIAGNKQTSFDAGGLKFWQNTTNADFSKKFDVAGGVQYCCRP